MKMTFDPTIVLAPIPLTLRPCWLCGPEPLLIVNGQVSSAADQTVIVGIDEHGEGFVTPHAAHCAGVR